VAYAQDDHAQAEDLYRHALDDAEASGDGHGLAVVLEGVAALAIRSGEGSRGALLLGAANAVRVHDAIQRTQVEQRDDDRIHDVAAAMLGRGRFWETIREGQGVSRPDGIALAREVLGALSSPPAVVGD
jgi:hypothetical protein